MTNVFITTTMMERYLKRQFPMYDWQFVIVSNMDAYQLFITEPDRADNYSAIINALDIYGRSPRSKFRFMKRVGVELIKWMRSTS